MNIAVDIVSKTLGEVLTNLIVKACTAVYGSWTAAPEITADVGAITLGEAGSDSEVLVLTPQQLDDVAEFLETPEVAATVQSYLLLACVQGRSSDEDPTLLEIRASFDRLARAWGTDGGAAREWTHDAAAIWEIVTANMRRVAPDSIALQGLPKNERALIVGTAAGRSRIAHNPPPRYIRLIVDVMQDLNRISLTRELCADICRASAERTKEMHLEHASERHRFSHDDLYVRRTITPRTRKSDRGLASVFDSPLPGARLVVFGHPGVGKSTLVNRFVHSLATRSALDFAPLIVRCRELGPDLEKSPVEHLVRHINQDLGLKVVSSQVEDLLALGRAFVIYDGVDEVTDLQQRRKLIKSIELFASTYRLTSIVCTTRKIGYESASFSSGDFPVFELEEYSEQQVEEYAAKWFKVMGRPEVDRRAFLAESEEIYEIRRNPLMLSLLCTLYRVRGFIPMNRRDVYKECADLLFYSWDAMRHIPQPVDHRRYGHNLMEELADFFFKFSSATAGIEEGQLTRLIATYFVDTAGVAPGESVARAENFLDFCAGRAWLLTATGYDDRGGRVFAFTHRTFMEFYAAEALVRRARDQRTVLDAALEVYRKNPSAVLPDLIFEAYENKQHRGAELLLRDLLKEGSEGRKVAYGSHIPLCLRVINSTPVGAPLVTEVLVAAFRYWSKLPGAAYRSQHELEADKKSFLSLLQLYRDPRQICRSLLLNEGYGAGALERPNVYRHDIEEDRAQFRAIFMIRWAELSAAGDVEIHPGDWKGLARDVYPLLTDPYVTANDAVRLYAVSNGLLNTEDLQPEHEPLCVRAFGEPVAGVAIRALDGYLSGAPTEWHVAVVRAIGQRLEREALHVDGASASEARGVLANLAMRYGERSDLSWVIPREASLLSLWLSLILAEDHPGGLHTFQHVMRHLFPDDLLYRIMRTRLGRGGGRSAAEEVAELKNLTRVEREALRDLLPRWVERWIARRCDLIPDDLALRL